MAPTSTPVRAVPPVGRHAHQQAVERLLASYAALPAGAPVRLAKPTSNLFRSREPVAGAGLDVTGLDDVIEVDTVARTADVQGMCTYERLVDVTLAYGLMPYVVPQLRTITLGGAVSGLGIESTSWRHGLPHESVRELDVLTGGGELVTAGPGEHEDLLRGFPNSYGTLGYATRLRIALEPVRPFVALRHERFDSPEELVAAVGEIVATGGWHGEPVDFLDGTMFAPDELYLSLGRWAEHATATSDYTGQQVYYRSIRERPTDMLTVRDYLWRWDTDWFWCSRAFGAQHRWLRRAWPRRWRRSDVYHRLVRLEGRVQLVRRVDRLRGRPARERVVQDVEIPLERTAQFLRWFSAEVGMAPVWLCPLRLRHGASGHGTDGEGADGQGADGARPWPLYPLQAGRDYVNVGFWGTVPLADGGVDGQVNRRVEDMVHGCGGHKSLYSDAYYGRDEFWRSYGGDVYPSLKQRYDPDGRLLDLYDKAVRRG